MVVYKNCHIRLLSLSLWRELILIYLPSKIYSCEYTHVDVSLFYLYPFLTDMALVTQT